MKTERISFTVLVLLLEILCIAILVLVLLWSEIFLAGFAWDGTEKEFDYHPVFMVISMIILYSQGKILCMVVQGISRKFSSCALRNLSESLVRKGIFILYYATNQGLNSIVPHANHHYRLYSIWTRKCNIACHWIWEGGFERNKEDEALSLTVTFIP